MKKSPYNREIVRESFFNLHEKPLFKKTQLFLLLLVLVEKFINNDS